MEEYATYRFMYQVVHGRWDSIQYQLYRMKPKINTGSDKAGVVTRFMNWVNPAFDGQFSV